MVPPVIEAVTLVLQELEYVLDPHKNETVGFLIVESIFPPVVLSSLTLTIIVWAVVFLPPNNP